ncbi:rho guanine nucleotide exchange factor 11-like isoform X2 [Haliotis cracherodii]|uniref:rho guanine nucleotide exchange factor 11-like isoform X2 n=1 Tax=Haliotis cracherodii TaxID=6455 RepID=UPI0039E81F0F
MDDQGKKSHRPSLSFTPSSFISRLKLRNNTEPPPSPVETEHYALLSSDPELDVEPGLPVLKDLLGARAAKALKQQERNRQETLTELLHTERLHVRVLKVLDEMFRKPMLSEYQQVAQRLFPELDQMLCLHREFNKQLHARRDESPVIQHVADVLLSLFDGDKGRLYREACAKFCRKQSQSLWNVKKCKDPHLTQLISKAESSPICRHMKLKDMMSAEMQRLAKYPLFIEDIVKYTDDSEELRQLDQALQESKNILTFVKHTVAEYENHYRFSAILDMLDKSSIDNSPRSYLYAEVRDLDVKRNTLVYDGILSMKLRSHRTMDVHVVLLEHIMVLLQKQDDKLVLCNFNDKETYKTHSPLLQLQKLIAREDAADKKAFMVINSQAYKPEMYQFVANSQVERDRWVKCLNGSVARSAATPPRGKREPSTSQENSSKSDPISPADKPTQTDSDTADSLIQPHEVHVSGPDAGQDEQVLTPMQKLHRNDHTLEASLEERKNILADIKVDTVMGGNHDDHHSSSLFLIKEAEEINSQLTQLVINTKCLSAPETSQSWSARTEQHKVTLPIPVEQLQEVTSKMNHCITKLHKHQTETVGKSKNENRNPIAM